MKHKLLLVLLLGCTFSLSAQYVTLSGYVKDTANGEDLIGVSIYTTEPRYGTVTNAYGFYSLTLPAGTYEVTYSYLGYSTVRRMLNLTTNRTLNVNLSEESQQLQEVVVTGNTIEETNEVDDVDITASIPVPRIAASPKLFPLSLMKS